MTCWYRATGSWARWTAAGPSPWISSRTSAARLCGTAPRTCNDGWSSCSTSFRPESLDPTAVGEATQLLWAFRARSRATQRRLAAGETLGAETSVDKVLVATAEQTVFDLVADGLGTEVAIGDDPVSRRWRAEFLYSRAATIYGGSAEVQRNIIARRLLDLGADR